MEKDFETLVCVLPTEMVFVAESERSDIVAEEEFVGVIVIGTVVPVSETDIDPESVSVLELV